DVADIVSSVAEQIILPSAGKKGVIIYLKSSKYGPFKIVPSSAGGGEKKAVRQEGRSAENPRRTEAEDVVAGRRQVPEAEGTAHEHGPIEERAATQDTAIYTLNISNIFSVLAPRNARTVEQGSLLAPFQGVAQHVEQPQVVRLQAPHRQ